MMRIIIVIIISHVIYLFCSALIFGEHLHQIDSVDDSKRRINPFVLWRMESQMIMKLSLHYALPVPRGARDCKSEMSDNNECQEPSYS